MTRLRPALCGLTLTVSLVLVGCSASSSGSSSAPVPTGSTASGSAAGGSAAQFCATFQDASERFGSDNTFPTKSQTGEARKFADDLEANAPAEMKQAAHGLATYFRAIADGVDKGGSNPSPNPSVLAGFAASIGEINTWAQANCK
jgi:hypothetical protein